MDIVNLTRDQVMVLREALEQYSARQEAKASEAGHRHEAMRTLHLSNAGAARVALIKVESAVELDSVLEGDAALDRATAALNDEQLNRFEQKFDADSE